MRPHAPRGLVTCPASASAIVGFLVVVALGCGSSAHAPHGPRLVVTADGRAAAPHLGEGWRCTDHEGKDAEVGVDTALVGCQRDGLAVLASDAIHQEAPEASAKEIAAVVAFHLFVEKYGPSRVVSEQKTTQQGHDAYEVEMETNDGATHIRDRVVVLDHHILDVAAMGSREKFRANAAEIDRWFEGARFSILAPPPAAE